MKMIGIFAALGLNISLYGQSADVTVVVKGIKEAKGKVMVAAGDKAKSQEMIGEMAAVTSTGDVVCVLKNVPVGKTNIYVYQDLNENFRLDMDEQHIPIEPCNTKEKVTIKDGENKFEIKLLNIKEMMGKR
ncbi:DUF2141 domain-containing protein [Tannerella forsythia]|uniref:DUF2141 domain-containing protein n=2 Tax=Tannerella forsythia TaxID=28112 RepID=A0A3P1XSB5_TANFO|nr:DUF2141 domain-containing protein [Tannerella forsythia]